MLNLKRVRFLNTLKYKSGPVVYWMSRDQRVADNWALLYAQEIALKNKFPLIVAFSLTPNFIGATLRHYDFMLKSLEEIEVSLRRYSIPFIVLSGSPDKEIPKFLGKLNAGFLVADFSPLRIGRRWRQTINSKIKIPFHEVDAHNIVPCWIASPKQEFGAYTFRPKINRLLPEFLTPFPRLKKMLAVAQFHRNNWQELRRNFRGDQSVLPIPEIHSGEKAAQKALKKFLNKKLHLYERDRNNPNQTGQSGLSPYLHFGQLSAQRVALEVLETRSGASKPAFLEELIVRRELSDNFCFYNSYYDSIKCFPAWAQRAFARHSHDKRTYRYSKTQFEKALTHDPLWNAAQIEMVKTGKMHGYLRMYWAKKILEWTVNPAEAMKIAIYLNDKYELDGRDPNGYAGIAWSIGGIHDRAWGNRPIFGQVRYMNYNGMRRKFDVEAYIRRFDKIA